MFIIVYSHKTKGTLSMNKDDYVKLNNLSDTQNHLLNILWMKNREMSLDELKTCINQEFATQWNRGQIRKFMDTLVIKEYVKKQRHKLRTYYTALSLENALSGGTSWHEQ